MTGQTLFERERERERYKFSLFEVQCVNVYTGAYLSF